MRVAFFKILCLKVQEKHTTIYGVKIHYKIGIIFFAAALMTCVTAEKGVEMIKEIAVPSSDTRAVAAVEDTEPLIQDAPEPVEKLTEPEPAPVPVEQEEAFIVTEEIYKQTFTEVEQIIMDLNEIIRQGDFKTWKSYLTDRYIEIITKEEKLKELSNNPILKQENIELNSLEDYFRYVVVPSRSKPRLDQIEFFDENRVVAIMIIQGKKYILYQLIYKDGQWKITVF